MLFRGLIVQKVTQQSTVTTLTTKAELLALEHVTKETVAIKRFFNKLTVELGKIQNIQCNN